LEAEIRKYQHPRYMMAVIDPKDSDEPLYSGEPEEPYRP